MTLLAIYFNSYAFNLLQLYCWRSSMALLAFKHGLVTWTLHGVFWTLRYCSGHHGWGTFIVGVGHAARNNNKCQSAQRMQCILGLKQISIRTVPTSV
jgi:hypothetical protein